MSVLIVTAVEAEAKAIGNPSGATVIVGGVGRTNAAVATTRALLGNTSFHAVINAGIAGILPGSGLEIGDILLADACVYAEEGVETPDGFRSLESMGFTLGDFPGNRVPVDASMLNACLDLHPAGPIATVATCSGTDALATTIVERTQALAEAMEGAAVVHAALLGGLPALEVRAMSNTTGDRANQHWDIPAALAALGHAIGGIVDRLAP